jgi:eukaryotic-like serine/threonine-protein kinase
MFFLKKLIGLLSFSVVFYSCSRKGTELPSPPVAEKEITSFSVTKADGSAFELSELSVTINTDSIQIVLPPLSDRSGIKASFGFKGKSVVPANGSVQDFSSPVTYTVTADNGSTKQYIAVADYPKVKSFLYIGAGNNFYALDAATGMLKWSYTGGGSFVYSSATYKEGVIYVGCIDNYIYAFNAINGRLLWKYLAASTGVESDAVVSGRTVYVGTNDDKMLAIDAVTGLLKWSFQTGGNISSSPKIANDRVYFGSSDSKFYCVEANNGQLVWTYQTGGMINQSGASLVNGKLYFGSRDGYLHCINASNGTLNWKFGTGVISFEQSSPTVDNNIVYIGGWYNVPGFNIKGSIYAVNASTGILIWEQLANTGFSSSPFINNNRLFISGDDNKISALQASNGNILWQKTILPNSSSPVEADGTVYVGGGGTGYIYALDASTGNEKWKFPIPGALMTSSPVLIRVSGQIEYPGDSGEEN